MSAQYIRAQIKRLERELAMCGEMRRPRHGKQHRGEYGPHRIRSPLDPIQGDEHVHPLRMLDRPECAEYDKCLGAAAERNAKCVGCHECGRYRAAPMLMLVPVRSNWQMMWN